MQFDETMRFKPEKNTASKTQELVKDVYKALDEKGYNPTNQLVGYILSGDPTYITNHNSARQKIRTLERDELLEKMLEYYIGIDK